MDDMVKIMNKRGKKEAVFHRNLSHVLRGILAMFLMGCTNQAKGIESNLIAYDNSSSGGMNGGSWSETIQWVGEDVIISESKANWWYENPKVLEYKVDAQILMDIGQIFKENNMQNWKSEMFREMIIYDAPSHSYHFTFEDGESAGFSAQAYPDPYGKTLAKISEVISAYRAKGILLPGYTPQNIEEEESTNRSHPNNGRVDIEIYEYMANQLTVRIYNGTDQMVEIDGNVKIIRNEDGAVVCESVFGYPCSVYENSKEEKRIGLEKRFEEGMYTLYLDDYTTEFEIRLPQVQE